ncbi:MAG: DUF533 domain-containing protein [Planctomycetota bacterium]
MDAMDVLGALLGRKKSSSGGGGGLLRDIVAGTTRQSAPNQQRRTQPPRQGSRPRSIGEVARSLEELLNVTEDRYAKRHPKAATPVQPPANQRRYQPPAPQEEDSLNEQAVILIRAMIGAAKSDGQISADEQREITAQLGHLSQNEIEFLRREFARPSDPRGIAWDTPLGMEEHVYTISLAAIDLDENKEAEYLADLAHGLRLTPSRCNGIHQRYGAPTIFRV